MKPLMYTVLWVTVLSTLFLACTGREELFSEADLKLTDQAFYEKWSTIGRTELYRVFEQPMTEQEAKAMKFLYAFMPLGDMVNEPDSLFLSSVRSALEARRVMSWGRKVPPELFVRYVLPLRVDDEEDLFHWRTSFFRSFAPTMKSMEMEEMVEVVVHAFPTDPSMTVSVLRTVSIPARLVTIYPDDPALAPRKGFEVWVDGEWVSYAEADRPAMVSSRVWGWVRGSEENLWADRCFTHLNLLPRYAAVTPHKITVKDPAGSPFVGAQVVLSVSNNGKKYRIANRYTDDKGAVYLTSQGSFLEAEVFYSGLYTRQLLSLAEGEEAVIILSGDDGGYPSPDPTIRSEEMTLSHREIDPCVTADSVVIRETKKNPRFLVSYCRQLALLDEFNPVPVPLSPQKIARLGVTDTPSRSLFFVSVCLFAGIRAEINPATQQPRYLFDGVWNEVVW